MSNDAPRSEDDLTGPGSGRRAGGSPQQDHGIPPDQQMGQVLAEGNMILPGVLSLLGLQFISMFNDIFRKEMPPLDRNLHLGAMGLLFIGVALVITPAAYHRQVAPESIPRDFPHMASVFLTCAMVPLILAFAIDFYLVNRLAHNAQLTSVALAAALAAMFIGFWFVFPRVAVAVRRRRGTGGS